ncbi:MAG TPA: glycosyltransferase, partial [Ohtaekwangia sp.]|uniref:glycosyltransferase n=1 Tax=Ohtaekwangia sp. TaxID=2066019 RepID=UPI002F94C623
MKRIKILFGLEAADGGALKHLLYLVENLNSSDFDITVILSDKRKKSLDKEIKRMIFNKARVLTMPMEREINVVKDFIALVKIVYHVGRNSYDIVHAHSSKAGILFRLAGWFNRVPLIVYTPHCFYFQAKSGVWKKVFSFIERLASGITDYIIVSDNERKAALSYKISSAQKLKNINNAIDFNQYKQYKNIEGIKQSLGIKTRLVIGGIGRLTEQKDWITYIYAANEVLKTYPHVTFLIVGEGELRTQLNTLVHKLNIADRVLVIGYREDIQKIYAVMDIFVSTSLWEGFPYVLLEAMYYKKPVVTTDIGYSSVITKGMNGYLSPTRDYHCIADNISLLIANASLCKTMGGSGYDVVMQNYSFELFIREHELLYKQQNR